VVIAPPELLDAQGPYMTMRMREGVFGPYRMLNESRSKQSEGQQSTLICHCEGA